MALEFNLSHSKDYAIYAFGLDRKIGIDLEYIHPMPDMDDFARQFFSLRENVLVNSLSGKQKEEAFFKIWTCKEAFLKANGSGLTVPINQVETSIESDGTVTLISTSEGNEQTETWHLKTLSPIPHYQAALAVNRDDIQITLRHLKDNPFN